MYYSENSFLFPPDPQGQESVQCGREFDPYECATTFESNLNYFSLPIVGQNLICLVNFVFQILAIWMVCTKKKFQQGSFFFLLITLALSILFRTLIFIITFMFAAFSDPDISSYSIPTTISLYVDATSANFSMVLIFFIALNRCLVIVKTSWSEAIFEGKRVIIPVIISSILSVIGAFVSIRTSKITRRYQFDMGFIDFGEPNGFRKLITRLFYMFPLSSAICYLKIFWHLKKNKKKLLAHNNSKNKGQQNVFIQILITVFFYGIMSAISEYLGYVDQAGFDIQLTLISIFNLLNYLPELCLPFLLVLNNCKPKKKATVVVAVSQSNSIIRRSDMISIK